MASTSTKLSITPRSVEGSRSTRRLRREGLVPGVLYGGGEDPVAFSVDQRDLRLALAGRGAVLEVAIGGTTAPAVLKDTQTHPVRGETLHVDLLRVNLDIAIQAVVALELTGADEAPGAVRDGGVLAHVTRELNIEALPTAIPESISLDVSAMEINDTLTLAAVTPPDGVTLLDDLEETVVATLTPPRLEVEEDEIESETELVGEGEAEGSAEDAGADDVPADADDSGGE